MTRLKGIYEPSGDNNKGESFFLDDSPLYLFHRNRLGKIPWLVNILAFANRNVISQHL